MVLVWVWRVVGGRRAFWFLSFPLVFGFFLLSVGFLSVSGFGVECVFFVGVSYLSGLDGGGCGGGCRCEETDDG